MTAIPLDRDRSGVVSPEQWFAIASNLGAADYGDQEHDYFAKINDERMVKAANLETFDFDPRRIRNIFGSDARSLDDTYAKTSVSGKEAISNLTTTSNLPAKLGSAVKSGGGNAGESLAAFIVSEPQSFSPDASCAKLKSLFARVHKRDRANQRVRLAELGGTITGAPDSHIFADQAGGLDANPQLRRVDVAMRAEAIGTAWFDESARGWAITCAAQISRKGGCERRPNRSTSSSSPARSKSTCAAGPKALNSSTANSAEARPRKC